MSSSAGQELGQACLQYRMGGISQAGQKERGARKAHKRLLYCVSVKRTSLDHLLLGMDADVDEMSHGPSIARS
jgi:hypothetical protein